MDLPLMEILGTDISGPLLTSPKRELQAVEVTKVEPVTQNFLPTFSVMPCMRVCHLLFAGGRIQLLQQEVHQCRYAACQQA